MRSEKSHPKCISREHSKIRILSQIVFGVLVSSVFSGATLAQSSTKSSPTGAPVYKIKPVVSKIDFGVKASVSIEGTFDKWDASLTDDPEGKGTGELKGTMAFDRKEFGMNSGIPFIRIADRVEVTIDFTATRISGSPLLFK